MLCKRGVEKQIENEGCKFFPEIFRFGGNRVGKLFNGKCLGIKVSFSFLSIVRYKNTFERKEKLTNVKKKDCILKRDHLDRLLRSFFSREINSLKYRVNSSIYYTLFAVIFAGIVTRWYICRASLLQAWKVRRESNSPLFTWPYLEHQRARRRARVTWIYRNSNRPIVSNLLHERTRANGDRYRKWFKSIDEEVSMGVQLKQVSSRAIFLSVCFVV